MIKLRIVQEAGPEYGRKQTITCAQDVANAMAAVCDTADREMFHAIYLDSRNRILGVSLVSVGTVNATLVHPREVLKPAILANAAAMVISHNHPSGDPSPSNDDDQLTQRLCQAADLLGIKILDHVVTACGSHYSYQEHNRGPFRSTV